MAAQTSPAKSSPAGSSAAERPSLTLTRRFAAPPEKVYEAWTVPQKMIQWWGASNAASRTAKADVRVGGRFHVGFRGNNGDQHDVSGIYREVLPAEKLGHLEEWVCQ